MALNRRIYNLDLKINNDFGIYKYPRSFSVLSRVQTDYSDGTISSETQLGSGAPPVCPLSQGCSKIHLTNADYPISFTNSIGKHMQSDVRII